MTGASKTKKRGRTRRPRSTPLGRQLLASLKEIHAAVLSGDPYRGMTVRQVEIPDPGKYDAQAVRALRKRLGVSVAVFAHLTGVSPKLVEHWEQGRREPAALARRLFDRIKADPTGYMSELIKTKQVAPSR